MDIADCEQRVVSHAGGNVAALSQSEDRRHAGLEARQGVRVEALRVLTPTAVRELVDQQSVVVRLTTTPLSSTTTRARAAPLPRRSSGS